MARTRVVLGGQDYRFKDLSGVRVVAGGWFTDAQTVGAEASFFILPEKHAIQGPAVATGDLPVLARPFFDPTINRQNVKLLSFPGLFTGGITSDYASRQLYAAIHDMHRAVLDLNERVGALPRAAADGAPPAEEAVRELAKGVDQLVRQMRAEQKVVREWVDEQAAQQSEVASVLKDLAAKVARRG